MSVMLPNHKIIVVLPAYNASKTLEKTVNDIPKDWVDEIILVDDASQDNTFEIAKALGLSVFKHTKNLGYGANQKTCYKLALEHGADYIIMLHPDYQYNAKVIPYALGFLNLGICDIILGNRIRTRKESLDGGMPLYKYLANRFLTFIENLFTGQNLGEWHSGFRAYRRKVLEIIPYKKNSDDFVFDSEFLIQATYFNFKIGNIPMPVKYIPEASSINFKKSIEYGFKTLLTLIKLYLHKWRIAKSKLFIKNDS